MHDDLPRRNQMTSTMALVPKHARNCPLYSERWYKVCNDAFVAAMRTKLGLRPEEPHEREARMRREMIESGDFVA